MRANLQLFSVTLACILYKSIVSMSENYCTSRRQVCRMCVTVVVGEGMN